MNEDQYDKITRTPTMPAFGNKNDHGHSNTGDNGGDSENGDGGDGGDGGGDLIQEWLKVLTKLGMGT